MKNKLLSVSIAAALLGIASVASAAVPDSFYFGVRGGYAHTDWDNEDQTQIVSSDDNGYGLGAFFGYSFNEYFSLEGGYNYFDGFQAQDGADTNGASEKYDFDINGPEISARLSLPLTDNGTDFFLRGGGMYAVSDNSHQFAPVVGAGMNIMLTDTLALRAGYDRYFNIYDNDDYSSVDMDLDFAYIGLSYIFAPEQPAAPAEPITHTVTTSYNLDASTLFAFDSAQLSPAGEEAVAKVVSDTNNANLDSVNYTVSGYTDRLGKAAYNQKLSQKRADIIAQSLVAHGANANHVTATGFGAADPVTGNECLGLKTKAELIKCYAPDRRVVINVTGTSSETQVVPADSTENTL